MIIQENPMNPLNRVQGALLGAALCATLPPAAQACATCGCSLSSDAAMG